MTEFCYSAELSKYILCRLALSLVCGFLRGLRPRQDPERPERATQVYMSLYKICVNIYISCLYFENVYEYLHVYDLCNMYRNMYK